MSITNSVILRRTLSEVQRVESCSVAFPTHTMPSDLVVVFFCLRWGFHYVDKVDLKLTEIHQPLSLKWCDQELKEVDQHARQRHSFLYKIIFLQLR